jgi:hypothetical protein
MSGSVLQYLTRQITSVLEEKGKKCHYFSATPIAGGF